MNREQKAAVVEEIAAQIQEAEAVIAVDYRGTSVPAAAALRARLREADATFRVVKNSLTERAADKADAPALRELLEGPTAFAFVRGDAAAAAKVLNDFAREHESFAFKGGLFEGEALDVEQIRAIARLPAREMLYGQLVGVVSSPLTGLVRGLNRLVAGLAVQLRQIADQGLVGDSAAAEEDAEAPADAGAEASGDAGLETPGEATDDQDSEPASDPEPAQPDQAEGEDTPAETSTDDKE